MARVHPRPLALPLALIVDHNDDTRNMYAEFLRYHEKCATEEAADGHDALAKAITLRPAVIVMETRLPGIDGFELCATLRREPLTRAIPIIVVTADGSRAHRERARESGANVVLIKPCTPDELLTEVLRVTDRWRERSGEDAGAAT